MGYDDIREALENFCVDNLHLVARLGHELLCPGTQLTHPSAVYAVAITAEKIAQYLDAVPVAVDSASAVEGHIKPKMLAVLNAAERNTAGLVMALDDLARAYSDAVPFQSTPNR